MTAVQNGIDEQAEDEAAYWAVLLQDKPDDAELYARFVAWRSASEHNALAWAAIQQTGDMIGKIPAAHRAQWGAFARNPAKAPRYRTLQRRQWLARATTWAGACVAACLVWTMVDWGGIGADYATGWGQTRHFVLADGTRVALAPHSALRLSYQPGQRGVELWYGEAYFDVRHDPDRPFSVVAHGVTTTDIGTAFDVAADTGSVKVQVAQGEVAVQPSRRAARSLKAAEATVVDTRTGVMQAERADALVGAWRYGQLSVQDVSMVEAIRRLRPFYRGRILVLGKGVSKASVTGFYRLDNPVAALRLMAERHNIRVVALAPWLVVVTSF